MSFSHDCACLELLELYFQCVLAPLANGIARQIARFGDAFSEQGKHGTMRKR